VRLLLLPPSEPSHCICSPVKARAQTSIPKSQSRAAKAQQSIQSPAVQPEHNKPACQFRVQSRCCPTNWPENQFVSTLAQRKVLPLLSPNCLILKISLRGSLTNQFFIKIRCLKFEYFKYFKYQTLSSSDKEKNNNRSHSFLSQAISHVSAHQKQNFCCHKKTRKPEHCFRYKSWRH
jgi:hypothetical protein